MRKLFRRSAITLLALFVVATVAIWIRSYWANDVVSLNWSRQYRATPSVIQVDQRRIDLNWGSGSLQVAYEYERMYPQLPAVDATRLNVVHYPFGKPVIAFGSTEWIAQFQRLGLYAWKESSGLDEILAPGLDGGYQQWVIDLPIGFLTASAALLILVVWMKTRRRFAVGRCLSCGYDLTGNVSGICPECGTAARHESALKPI